MKKYISIITIPAPAILSAQTINYTVKGTVGQLNAPAKAYLTYRTESGGVTDSATIQQGNFEFKGSFINPVKATLTIAHNGERLASLRKRDQLAIYLETATINVNAQDSVYKAEITGSKLNAENQELTNVLLPYTNQIKAAESAYLALPKEQRTAQVEADLEKQTTAIEESQKSVLADFIKKHPASLISLDALKTYGGYFPEASVVEPFYNSLTPEVKSSNAGIQYNKWLQGVETNCPGCKCSTFYTKR